METLYCEETDEACFIASIIAETLVGEDAAAAAIVFVTRDASPTDRLKVSSMAATVNAPWPSSTSPIVASFSTVGRV